MSSFHLQVRSFPAVHASLTFGRCPSHARVPVDFAKSTGSALHVLVQSTHSNITTTTTTTLHNQVKLASDLVDSNIRGEWKKGGALLEDSVVAVKHQEMVEPRATGSAVDLTGEEDHGPYRASSESSVANRLRRDD